MRRLRLVAAMALARVADWLDRKASRLAKAALDASASNDLGDIEFLMTCRCGSRSASRGRHGFSCDSCGAPSRYMYVSETGITRALAETEER